MKTLPAAHLKTTYYDAIERKIDRLFAQMIYKPLMRELKIKGELTNARDPLVEAVSNGIIEYKDGLFYGKFNASISKRLQSLGAVWRKSQQGFYLATTPPGDILNAIYVAEARYAELARSLIDILTTVDVDYIVNKASFVPEYDKSIAEMDAAIRGTMKRITIPPKLSPAARQVISREWSNNLKLYVQKWTKSEIVKLRSRVQQNTFIGQRSQNLINEIVDSYGVSKRKAKFLARQETSLLMSKMRQERYIEAGITKYKWSTSHDERVRHDHKKLNDTVHEWTDPPIVADDGRRAHPGEDFNCRCVPIPLLPGDA